LKAKTIKSILSKVHKDFVESIEDDRVKGLVEANSVISGGCIVSMLLKEPINDFDYYFTNKETAVSVAEYFLKKFQQKNSNYADYRVWVNGDRIEFSNGGRDVIGKYEAEDDLTEYTDILSRDSDSDADHVDCVRDNTAEEKPKFQPVFITSNAISLTGKIQLVLRFYGTPDEIHANYDYVHATSYWSSSSNELVLRPEAMESILARELRYIGSKYPVCSIFRSKKFIQRGWTINAGQFLKMAWQISELDLTNVDVLRDQLVGVDSVYFLRVIESLKRKQEENPGFKIEQTYLFEIINRIF